MKSVGTLVKDRELYTVKSGTFVVNAVLYMAEKNIGAVGVVDKNENLIGLFSERDLLKRVVGLYKEPSKTLIDEVMTKTLVTATPDAPYQVILNKMKELNIRHMPIIENNKLIGMVSFRDLLELEFQVKADEIKYLQEYIGQNPS